MHVLSVQELRTEGTSGMENLPLCKNIHVLKTIDKMNTFVPPGPYNTVPFKD
jgi:hypothetical protein